MFEIMITPDPWHEVCPLMYGYEACSPGHSCGPHIRSYYLLHYVLAGKGCISWENETALLEQGDLFIIHPGEITTYSADPDSPWEYGWLSFQSTNSLSFLEPHVIPNAPGRRIFEEIRDLEQVGNCDARIFSLVFELLWQLSRISDQAVKRNVHYASYVKSYIEANYMKPIRIQDLASSLHIDRRYMGQLFRTEYGVSPQSFLTEIRLSKAREFLKMGYGVSQSANLSGFTDLPNFSRRYKIRYGVTPNKDVSTAGLKGAVK